MKNKALALAALAEGATGVIVVACPLIAVRLLFAAEIHGAGICISRFAGISLMGLSVSCWPGKSAFQPLNGMLTYSTLAMLYFAYLGIRGETVGLLLWPAVVAHLVLVVLLLRTRLKEKTPAA